MSEESKEAPVSLRWGWVPELIEFEKKIEAAHTKLGKELEEILHRLEGQSIPTFEAKLSVARRIQFILSRLELRVECPTCGKESFLRCRSVSRNSTGTFQFDHPGDMCKTTSHGGYTTLPKLKLIPASPNKRWKSLW
jgi:hypothetical protein